MRDKCLRTLSLLISGAMIACMQPVTSPRADPFWTEPLRQPIEKSFYR
jgi:hypothetical protein